MTATAYYPPWGFFYKVKFSDSSEPNDARFQSVSGLSVEYDTEEYKEGGENRFTHKLPVRTKYSDLVLKRGLLTGSAVTGWFLAAFRERAGDFGPLYTALTRANLELTVVHRRSLPPPLIRYIREHSDRF